MGEPAHNMDNVLEAIELLGTLDEQRLAVSRDGHSGRAFLQGAPQQGGLKVPIAEHRGGGAQQLRIDQGKACPARFRIDPLERLMILLIGDGVVPCSNRLTASFTSLTGNAPIPSMRNLSRASWRAWGTCSTTTMTGAAPAADAHRT